MERKRILLYVHPVDPMGDLTICRNCGKVVEYGKCINYKGHDSCPGCFPTLQKHIDYIRENDYEQYRKSHHLYIMNDNDYKQLSLSLINKSIQFLENQKNKL